jgi:hypothetical protein
MALDANPTGAEKPRSLCGFLAALMKAPVRAEREKHMSAFIVSKKHVDLIVAAVTCGTRDGIVKPSRKSKDKLGQMLVTECVASVSYRYPNDDVQKGELPGPCDAYYVKPYRWEDPKYRPSAAELLNAINCYMYQSCEHPGWKSSTAHQFCEELVVKIESLVQAGIGYCNIWPEYEAAPWDFDEEAIAICYAKADPDGRSFIAAFKDGDLAAAAAMSDWLIERGLLEVPIEPNHLRISLGIHC